LSFWKNIYLNRKELVVLLVLKLAVVLYFNWQYQLYWPANQQQGWAMLGNDTSGYMRPLEAMVQGYGYDSVCRMPAFAPLYFVCYFIFGSANVLSALVLFQVFMSWISAVLIFLILKGNSVSNQRSLIGASVFLLFPLIATYDHLILSDSLGNSFFLVAIYLAWRAKQSNSQMLLFLTSFFLVWSGFFRQIHFIFLPFLFWYAVPKWWSFSKVIIKKLLIFIFPFFVLVGSWAGYNKMRTNQWIFTVAPYETCFGYLPKPLLELRKLMIAMGGDIQPWVKGSAGEFFIGKEDRVPFQEKQFTSNMSEPELKELKRQYQNFYYRNDSLAGEFVIQKSNEYLEAYKSEHPSQFYFTNRLNLLVKFVFPNHADNLPGPAIHEMNIFQKGMKAFAWVGMFLINVFAFFCVFLSWRLARDWFVLAIANVLLILILACFFGWIELRYLLPIHSLSLLLIFIGTRSAQFPWKKNNTP